MEHAGEYRRKNRDGRQYSSHTGKIDERMRRGAVMARAGEGMPVVKRCGVDWHASPAPMAMQMSSRANIGRALWVATDSRAHLRVTTGTPLTSVASNTAEERAKIRRSSVPASSPHCQERDCRPVRVPVQPSRRQCRLWRGSASRSPSSAVLSPTPPGLAETLGPDAMHRLMRGVFDLAQHAIVPL